MIKIMVAFALAATLSSSLPAQKSWCLKPRSPEPLLAEARRIGTSTRLEAVETRQRLGLKRLPLDSIRLINDEVICKAAASAYWTFLRKILPDLFGTHPDSPVLVARVG